MANDLDERILEVPVVDIGALTALKDDASVGAQLNEENPALREVIANIRSAAAEWGFFYITNHGVSEKKIEGLRQASRDFFALPEEVKNRVRRTETNQFGFFNKELTKQKLDNKEVFDIGGRRVDGPATESAFERLGDEQNQWLEDEELPGFRQTLTEYFDDMTHISRRLIQVFAVALGERFDFFDQFFHRKVMDADGADAGHDHTSLFRLNHYPPSNDPENTMGVYHHTDIGAVTVLLQDDDVATLQVFHRGSQTWVNVPPRKNTYTINIGDMIQVWSNDKFVAPLHRVKAHGEKERFSAPFFYFPSYKTVAEPIVVKGDDKPHYRAIQWRDFLLSRYNDNNKDLGVEVQISNFRVDEV